MLQSVPCMRPRTDHHAQLRGASDSLQHVLQTASLSGKGEAEDITHLLQRSITCQASS